MYDIIFSKNTNNTHYNDDEFVVTFHPQPTSDDTILKMCKQNTRQNTQLTDKCAC